MRPYADPLYVALFGALILLADVRLSLFAYRAGGSYALYEAAAAETGAALAALRPRWRC